MHDVVNYAIFWKPPGFSFDNPAIDSGALNASDFAYESLIESYLMNVGSSSFYNILQQYTDHNGPPGASTFGGRWSDDRPFPGGRGSKSNPLVDSDIVDEVAKAMTANGWTAGVENHEFFVFTPYGVYEEGLDFCAWHSFTDINGSAVIFSYMMDPGNPLPAKTCAPTDSPTPNNDRFADYEINILSHEQFESVTDPYASSWYFGDTAHEVADECSWLFGDVDPDGGNVVLNGLRFRVQQEWSNAEGGCYLPPLSVSLTLGYDILGGSAGSIPPIVTFHSAGLLISQMVVQGLVTVNPDVGTMWSVSGNLSGSSAHERWTTLQKTSGSANSPTTVHYHYYHQYQVAFSYDVSGGRGHTFAPPATYYSFGTLQVMEATPSPASSVWADAQSSYSYPAELLGSSGTERWETPDRSGTVGSASHIMAEYYHQYLVIGNYSLAGGGHHGVPTFNSTIRGEAATVSLGSSQGGFWVDSGAEYSVSSSLQASGPEERWELSTGSTGAVNSPLILTLQYGHQFYVRIVASPTGGGSVSGTTGWYDAGAKARSTASPSEGWQFEVWTGSGAGAFSGKDLISSFEVDGPLNQTAVFYPGLTLIASTGVTVSYSYGGVSGTVPSGSKVTFFVPINASVAIDATLASFISSFTGWSIGALGNQALKSVLVDSPVEVTAGSGYNYPNIRLLLGFSAVIAATGLYLLRTRSRMRSSRRR